MRSAWLALALVTACDPVWSLRGKVRSPDGAPLRDAALAITCRPDGNGLASLSDETGALEIGGLGWELPEGCRLTVAKPGFRTRRLSFEELCAPRTVADCHRAQEIDLVLEPAP